MKNTLACKLRLVSSYILLTMLLVHARETYATDTFSTAVDGVTIVCGKVTTTWVPGVVKGARFVSYSSQVAALKKQLKSASSQKKKTQLKTKIKALAVLVKSYSSTCKAGPPGGDPSVPGETPTPTPSVPGTGGTPTPTPKATPTPGSSGGNFDAQGNLTAQGKSAFGVPSNLSGNISAGSSLHSSRSCSSCHGEKTGRSFAATKASMGLSQMNYIVLSDGDIANLTAYLNRFKL